MHYLCLIACGHRADTSLEGEESARTLGVLDVDGYKFRLDVKEAQTNINIFWEYYRIATFY